MRLIRLRYVLKGDIFMLNMEPTGWSFTGIMAPSELGITV